MKMTFGLPICTPTPTVPKGSSLTYVPPLKTVMRCEASHDKLGIQRAQETSKGVERTCRGG